MNRKRIPPTWDKWAQLLRSEIGALLALFVLGGALYTFVELVDEVSDEETISFDRAVLLALREADRAENPVGPRWLEVALADITSLGGTVVLTLMVLVVAGFLLLARKYHATAYVLAASVGGALLTSALKFFFDRPRPDVVVHLVDVSTTSFPSGHALSAAAIYLTLGALVARVLPQPRLKIYTISVAVLLTMVIGISRIYLGVHWPTDVLAGWCMGSAWAITCWLVAGWFQRKGWNP